jgi:pimeloyl-ACP methyl ester carboxylesterase
MCARGWPRRAAGRALLLHGFPDWPTAAPRDTALAAAGCHAIAPDQRGYGRTTGCDVSDGDWRACRILNLVRDALGLLAALEGVRMRGVGHDFGLVGGRLGALLRPDVFRPVVLMSAPFSGAPALPFGEGRRGASHATRRTSTTRAAALPRPREHYQHYYCGRGPTPTCGRRRRACRVPARVPTTRRRLAANRRTRWRRSRPVNSRSCHYYVMDLEQGMAATVAARCDAAQMRPAAGCPTTNCACTATSTRTGFQGGSIGTAAWPTHGQLPSAGLPGRTIDVPSLHRRCQRLGRVPKARRFRGDAGHGAHTPARLPSRRRGRPLGAAGQAAAVNEWLVQFLRDNPAAP